MENLDNVIYLMPFAPLIQLWAGICLLFFYCELLDKSPFQSAKTKLFTQFQETYDELTTKYQVFVPEDNDIYNSISLQKDTHWDYFRTSIYCMAIFCFFYALIILIVAGIEKHCEYGAYYQALQVTNTIAFLYYILNSIKYKSFWGQSKLCAICFALGLGLYIPFHFIISERIQIGESWNQSSISIYTLITCIAGLLLILIHLLIDWYTIYKCKKSIERIKRTFNIWTQLPFSKNTRIGKMKLIWMLLKNSVYSLIKDREFEWESSNKKILEMYLKQKIHKELTFLNKKLQQD